MKGKKIRLFFFHFNGEKIPKQSSSLLSPRDIKGRGSPESLDELAAEDVSLVARSWDMTLKYSSSVLALAKRDWAFDFWERNVL